MNDKVSIITVNYNGFKDTCEMAESLEKHEDFPYELIIVDNASTEREDLLLKEKLPFAKIIRSDINLGFAGGNNLGVKEATGNYLFFINNDTIVNQPILKTLIAPLQNNPQIGCVSPKTTFYPDTNILQYAGATPMSRITLRNKFIGYKELDCEKFNLPQITAFANGAAMVIRTADIEKFGLMREFYFLYYEELDWCVRMQKAGFSIWYEPRATVGHKESVSVGYQSPLQVYYHTRNRYIFARETIDKPWERLAALLYLQLIAVPKRLVEFLLKRKFNLLKPLISAYFDMNDSYQNKVYTVYSSKNRKSH